MAPSRTTPRSRWQVTPPPTTPSPITPRVPPRAPLPVTAGADGRFWFCLHLPLLPLEALPEEGGAGPMPGGTAPRAVTSEAHRREWVVVADDGALAVGVRPGMGVSSALALAPGLRLEPRDPARELAVLRRLANWATRYTPAVSLEPPDVLLLEVRASLKLFGGPGVLGQGLLRGLRERRHRVVMAGAPTALGACWLARAGQALIIDALPDLRGRLGALPIAATGWPGSAREMLAGMGVTTLGDCLRLPRQGLARRLGPRILRELDQAFGRLPELRRWHEPPSRFRETLDLDPEVGEGPQLLAALEPLLGHLGHRLGNGQAALRTLWCRLGHSRPVEATGAGGAFLPGPDGGTWLRLGLRRPSSNLGLITSLLRERLAGVSLGAPASSILLLADLEEPAGPGGRDLLGQPLVPGASLTELLDRLRARLGEGAVHGLALLPEHRPEWAWRAVPPGDPGAGLPWVPAPGPRPVWLLGTPRRLGKGGGSLVAPGSLCLEEGPERIETGWWDGSDIRRDYFRARTRAGLGLWVFRELRTGDWYLHGIFE